MGTNRHTVVVGVALLAAAAGVYCTENKNVYTTSWAVEITEGGEKMADAIAARHGFTNLGQVSRLNGVYHFELTGRERQKTRYDSPLTAHTNFLLSEPSVVLAEQQVLAPRALKSCAVPNDPLFHEQWNLANTGQLGEGYKGNDLRVQQAWMQGLTGYNVTVAVVDYGIDYRHPDLWNNYAPIASYDFVDNDTDPFHNGYGHGTKSSGVIASAQDNKMCGVGIAYSSNLGGIRLLTFEGSTDLRDAKALSHASGIVDIYSNSWGVPDSGHDLNGPGTLTRRILKQEVTEGRNGKGSIFVFANGNGGYKDDCAADGYASSIFTISVGAIGVDGDPSPFDEQCSAKLVVVYVTDSAGNETTRTTEAGTGCTSEFGGTSAATSMVSGIVALALEANPELTWRDVQYLIVYTANPHLTAGNLTRNGAGLAVSRQFGFGVMDAEAMVTRARHWIGVPPQMEEHFSPHPNSGQATLNAPFTTSLDFEGFIHYLEHVVVIISASAINQSSRGHIQIKVTSPSGTNSTLLEQRPYDKEPGEYRYWPFMSVHFWGENPIGEWNLAIYTDSLANVSEVEFHFYGVSTTPEAVANIPDQCHSDCRRGCAREGSNFCDSCLNLRNASTLECTDDNMCTHGYTRCNGYCYDASQLKKLSRSDFQKKEFATLLPSTLHYDIERADDGISNPIYFPDELPLGCNSSAANVYVGTNGYFTFDGFTGFTPFEFTQGNSLSLVAPFFTDIDISHGNGQIKYEIFNDSTTAPLDEFVLTEMSDVINQNYESANFNAKWALVALWHDVPHYGDYKNVTTQFQGALVTNGERSFAVFTYDCNKNFKAHATIGVITGLGVTENHNASYLDDSHTISCSNEPYYFVNVVYEISAADDVCPIDTC